MNGDCPAGCEHEIEYHEDWRVTDPYGDHAEGEPTCQVPDCECRWI